MAKLEKLRDEIKDRADAWLNSWTGFGDPSRDASMVTRPNGTSELTASELDTLFDDDHLAHKICVRQPTDALRKWISLKLEGGKGSDDQEAADGILAKLDELGTRGALLEGHVWSRQRGGSLIVLGVDDGAQSHDPLREDQIKSFRFLNVVRADQASAESYYGDPMAAKYGQVETWRIKSAVRGGEDKVVHETRIVHLRGELTSPERLKARKGWDMSVLQRAKEPLQRNDQAWRSLAALLAKSNLLAFGVKGFTNMARQLQDTLVSFQNRMQIAKMTTSVNSWTVYDADGESMDNVSVNFGGIPEAMDRLMMEAASAADMPVTKLWGRSPAGQNATGESDQQNWEEMVEAYQMSSVEPALKRIVRLAMLTEGSATGGREPESWTVTFNPLRVMTESQVADTQVKIAQAVGVLLDRDVMTPEEVATGPLFGQGGILAGLADIDQDARAEMLKAELERMKEAAKNPVQPPPAFAKGKGEEEEELEGDDEGGEE